MQNLLKSRFINLRYYFVLAGFRMREPFTDFKATGVTYILYGFFIWILSRLWERYSSVGSDFKSGSIFFYIGVTELLFMSFLNSRAIVSGAEDFSLYLVRPRSWIFREIIGNIGAAFGKRILFLLSLVLFTIIFRKSYNDFLGFIFRTLFLIFILSLPQALLSSLFSALKLSFPQTEYFILPFGKVFLSLGGVFGPLSDYGEPWRSLFMPLPGADLFFQPAYYTVFGHFYQISFETWILKIILINVVLYILLTIFYLKGRKSFQAWGG